MYGTSTQAAKLVRAGLWHAAGHDCADCPQPATGDYVMHQYLTYNPTRRQVSERREKAAEKKRRQRSQGGSGPKPPSNRPRNEDDSSANRERIEDENDSIHRPVFDETPAQSDASPGDSLGTRARAFPSHPIPSKEQVADVGGEGTGGGARTEPRPDGRPPFNAPIDDDGFALTDALRRWAVSTFGTALDVDYETAQFIDHFRAQGVRRPNWNTEWQKWMRRSAKWQSERATRPQLRAVSGDGWKPWTNPTDHSAYKNGW